MLYGKGMPQGMYHLFKVDGSRSSLLHLPVLINHMSAINLILQEPFHGKLYSIHSHFHIENQMISGHVRLLAFVTDPQINYDKKQERKALHQNLINTSSDIFHTHTHILYNCYSLSKLQTNA